jgi:hypothetical protein
MIYNSELMASHAVKMNAEWKVGFEAVTGMRISDLFRKFWSIGKL